MGEITALTRREGEGRGPRVLLVDDDLEMCELLSDVLRSHGYRPSTRLSAEAALAVLPRTSVDVVVTDERMRETSGIELCRRVLERRPDVPVLLMTGFASVDLAVDALHAGVDDLLVKPFEAEELVGAIERALARRAQRHELPRRRSAQPERDRGQDELLPGVSPKLVEVRDVLRRAAMSDATVLLTGESGTGKGRAARALHEWSPRRGGPFVVVDCSALPEHLLESELFGHVAGAFTDARYARTGLFVQAHGGTLLLDEIGDLPRPLQPKLLRVLEDRTVRALGSNAETPVDVRIVAATHRDLELACRQGAFRDDLYFRIDVVRVELPPLRERREDVLPLARRFLATVAERTGRRVSGLSARTAERLLAHDWPGNVRELKNCMDHVVALARAELVEVEDLPARLRRTSLLPAAPVAIEARPEPSDSVGTPAPGRDLEGLAMGEVERRHILRVLAAAGGNKTVAARALGLDRKTLRRRLARFRAVGSEQTASRISSKPWG